MKKMIMITFYKNQGIITLTLFSFVILDIPLSDIINNYKSTLFTFNYKNLPEGRPKTPGAYTWAPRNTAAAHNGSTITSFLVFSTFIVKGHCSTMRQSGFKK